MKNIQLCPDGKYRWAYELSLYKNPHILFLIWKIFGWILFGIWVFMLILQVSDGILSAKEIVIFSLKFLGGIGALVFVLSILGYGLYAFIMGGKYCALFEMDGKGVEHKQMKAQVKKAQLIGVLTALAGLAGGRVGTVGQGMMVAGASGGMYSAFADVKSIVADTWKDTAVAFP